MYSSSSRSERLVFLFFVGIVFFQYPVLSLVNLDRIIAGFPLLYLYLFGVWTLFIVLIIVLIECRQKRKQEN